MMSVLASHRHASPASSPQAPRLLHVFPSFGLGGVPLRMVNIINHFGSDFSHFIISLDNNFDAAQLLSEHTNVTLMPGPQKKPGISNNIRTACFILRRLRPHLLITYNWGSIEWIMANRLWPVTVNIHFEAGFGKDEANGQSRRRVLCRRWAVRRSSRVVVPSRHLQHLALKTWRLPAELVTYLPNGVDVKRFSGLIGDSIPGFFRQPDELVIGTVAPLRPEKNIARLLRVFAKLRTPFPTRLIIAGDGIERTALERLSHQLAIGHRVIFLGHVKPESVLGTFDVFALSSDTEQMPNALLEAMAACRVVAAVDVGDVKSMVCEQNRRFIVGRDDEESFKMSIEELLRDATTREDLGMQNRERVLTEFRQEKMFQAYASVFKSALTQGRSEISESLP